MEKILIIDDEKDVHYSFGRIFTGGPYEILSALSGEEGIKAIQKDKPDVVIMDIRMGGSNGLETLQQIRRFDSRTPVIMMTAYGTTQTAIHAMKAGAFDYILKPFDIPRMRAIVESALKAARDMKQVVTLQPSLRLEDFAEGIVGNSEAMQDVYKMIGQVSHSDATILITGESGTGKELVARAIYHHSLRNSRPFLAINCAAIPENLLESELFGHEKGAFTGAAAQRIGKFEQCDGGTIFLDEIGDMSLPLQSKILRVLQEGEITRVGSNEPVKVNVRLVAATNKELEKSVAAREFREDLFYRLNVVRIHLPPLRERRQDIPVLAGYFLQKLLKKQPRIKARQFAPETLDLLQSHHWPGNVRELENTVLRSALIAKGDVILPMDLPPEVLGARSSKASHETPAGTANPDELFDRLAANLLAGGGSTPLLEALEKLAANRALSLHANDAEKAAQWLGISTTALNKLLKKAR